MPKRTKKKLKLKMTEANGDIDRYINAYLKKKSQGLLEENIE